jgi:hypothetical protein
MSDALCISAILTDQCPLWVCDQVDLRPREAVASFPGVALFGRSLFDRASTALARRLCRYDWEFFRRRCVDCDPNAPSQSCRRLIHQVDRLYGAYACDRSRFRREFADKRRRREQDEADKPLDAYRSEELASLHFSELAP